jgi:hypothetical protein
MDSIKYFLIFAIVFFLTILIVMTGCHNNCTHEIEHYEYHGKEGKSEYGEYDSN